jgi:ribosomal protein S2
MKEDTLLKKLFAANAYWGHQKKNRNPKLKNLIYSTINKIDIINLDYSVRQIEESKELITSYTRDDILMVSCRSELMLNGVRIVPKWKPGMLTNFHFGRLVKKPKLLIIDNAYKNEIALKEARLCNIKTIGICDTNSSLDNIDNFIVLNDDNEKAMQIALNNLLAI